MIPDDADQGRPKFRKGIDAINEAIEREEIDAIGDAIELEHEREYKRTLEWVEEKSREAISLADNEIISASDALRRIAAIVGYEKEQG